jgi:uncharacterized protein YeaO (DUF488 family)
MLRGASVYDPVEPDAVAGLRVLVMRYWPRGIKRERVDVWLKDAAPSRELLRAYAHEGLEWSSFEERFRAEIVGERADVLERLRELEREHGTLTLLCHERQGHCHREILLDLLGAC